MILLEWPRGVTGYSIRPRRRQGLLPTGGDHKSTRYLQGRALQPAFSPDGRWMAYAADESGSWEVFVQSVPAGRGKWQMSNHGGAQPVWRRDVKELFYKG